MKSIIKSIVNRIKPVDSENVTKLKALDHKMRNVDAPLYGDVRAMRIMDQALLEWESAARVVIGEYLLSKQVDIGEVNVYLDDIQKHNNEAVEAYSLCKAYRQNVLNNLGPKS
jgi:hypothetical protein